MGFHAFTGCDQTRKFCGKSKLTCWKIFTAANENIINAFQRFDDNEDDAMDSVRERLVQFVIKLYCEEVPKKNLTLIEARWYLYSKYHDFDRFPPTAAVLKYKILKTQLMCLIWKSSHVKIATSPDPEDYGWEMKDDKHLPIMTDQLPAPGAVIEMSLSKCRTGLKTMWCKCYKNQLGCTEMLLCANCENNGDESNKFWSDDGETDDIL